MAAGAFVAGRHHGKSGASALAGGRPAATTVPPTPFAVVSTIPTAGATEVPSNQVVTVNLSVPVSTATGTPTFSPPVNGTWRKSGPTSLEFDAAAPFIPTTTETLTIPSGAAGPHSAREPCWPRRSR